MWRDGPSCQLCTVRDASSYVAAHLLARGPAHPANLFLACKSCNVKQGQNTCLPFNFEQITQQYPRWRTWIRFLASLPQDQQQASIARDLHLYTPDLQTLS